MPVSENILQSFSIQVRELGELAQKLSDSTLAAEFERTRRKINAIVRWMSVHKLGLNDELLVQIIQTLNSAVAKMREAESSFHSLKQLPNDKRVSQSLERLAAVNRELDENWSVFLPPMGQLGSEYSSDLQSLLQVKANLQEKVIEAESELKRLGKLRDDFERAVGAAKSTVGELLSAAKTKKTAEFGSQFGDWADKQGSLAIAFLVGAVLSLGVAGFFIGYIPESVQLTLKELTQVSSISKDASSESALALAILSYRAALLVLGLTGFVFFSRQFNASRHVAQTARHRQKVAQLYQTLTLDPNLDTQILVTVLGAMISEPPSPYLRAAAEQEGSRSIPDLLLEAVAKK